MDVLVPVFQQAYARGSVERTPQSGVSRLHRMPDAVKAEYRPIVFQSGFTDLETLTPIFYSQVHRGLRLPLEDRKQDERGQIERRTALSEAKSALLVNAETYGSSSRLHVVRKASQSSFTSSRDSAAPLRLRVLKCGLRMSTSKKSQLSQGKQTLSILRKQRKS